MPMKTILIVDGHNVLYKLERYRLLKNQKLQLAADKLVVDLVNLSGSGDYEIIVVFDGGRTSTENDVGDVKVIYSGELKSADSVIEKLVFKIAEDRTVVICTLDNAQQKVVSRNGTSRLTPRELDSLFTDNREESQEMRPKSTRFRVDSRLPDSVRDKLEKIRRGL